MEEFSTRSDDNCLVADSNGKTVGAGNRFPDV